MPWGLLIGGEELHNNHHAYPTSARFSCKWYELDLGWPYIRILEVLGQARIKHLVPVPQFGPAKPLADAQTLQALLIHRYDVLARYASTVERETDNAARPQVEAMREELAALWSRSMDSSQQLVARLRAWCLRAEASGVAPLAQFSRLLRSYA